MTLTQALDQAESHRVVLQQKLESEETDCWRLFHGACEGRPGLTVDKYGQLILIQTFRESLTEIEISELEERYGDRFVYNHRGDRKTRFSLHDPSSKALSAHTAKELGLNYEILARHKGLDPYLFLDLRVGRRWLLKHSAGKSVLNLFAYTCGLGQVAAAGGASEVWNVDFSESALQIGRQNLARNNLAESKVRFLKEDYFAAIWQLSGIGVKGRRARRKFTKLKQREFDLVLLDPPARAKGSFHTVDLIGDYPSVFKPALLSCAPGGRIMATNNVGSVERDQFEQILRRCADKAGRPIKELRWLVPDDDFPSFDGQHPLKIALCEV